MAYNVIANIGEVIDVAANDNFNDNNKCVVQTLNNILCFCANATFTQIPSNGVLFKLPSSTMYPKTIIRHPIVLGQKIGTAASTYSIGVLVINTDGTVKLIGYTLPSNAQVTLQLNGMCINVNSTYYNPTIGNIYNNGTSPLSER